MQTMTQHASESRIPDDIVLAARDIRKVFEAPGQVRQEVLRGITLDFPRGQFCSIVGASGSGKSTLLYILGALDHATSGSIHIGGQRVDRLSQNELSEVRNRRLGFVFQFHFLLPEFTAIENVMLPALIQGKRRDAVEPYALHLLERVGLAALARQRSTRLSGGEQQRVALARALVNDPDLVMCDEPTGNLDTRNTEIVYNLLRELNEEQQQTMIVVTHDLEFAGRTDRTVRLVDGEVSEDQMLR
jgi:lipoprotein-releasing system ATP-binding protein